MIIENFSVLSPLELARNQYSDFHKEAFGMRPRGVDTSKWTLEKFEAEFEIFARIIAIDLENEKKSEQASVVAFNQRIADLIKIGAKDEAMALRWIHEAEGTNGDESYLSYILGLPYRYFESV